MNPLTLHLLAGLLIFASHLVAGITGFGNQIVALPLLAMLVGLDAGKCTLVVLGTVMYTILTVRWHERVNWRQLLIVVALAGVGLVIGMYVFEQLNERIAKRSLGVFVLLMGLQGLLRPGLLKLVPESVGKVLVLGGGVVHGAFTTGGPLLVVYAQRAMPEKGEFRSTLAVMWIMLNIGLMVGWTITRAWSPQTPTLCLVGLPFLIAGLSLGEYLHHKLDGPAFRATVNGVLILNGIVLILFAR